MPAVLSSVQIEEKRIGLVVAAIKILDESGIDALTLRHLADRAGVSRSTPYLYFKDKMALIDAVRVHGLQTLIETSKEAIADIDCNSEYVENMRCLGSVYVDFGLSHPALYQLIFVSGLPDEDMSDELRHAIEQHRTLLMTPMQDAYEAGVLSMPPERLDPVLWSAVHGLLSLRHAGYLGEGKDFCQVRTDVESILALGFLNIDHRKNQIKGRFIRKRDQV
ncbi:MAG: TetR/AcrR family transcriptional regulator [Rhizobiaceae bacterium]|nr:TetR/AcrR family transcriptional regulator [Rhizobiaceae bacterium]